MNRLEPSPTPSASAVRRLVPAIGPALIVAAVLLVLKDIAFLGKIPTQNLDLVAYFFPNHCFLGRSLAAGHVPGWDPYAMGGIPFAADPQSGWMNLPAMLLYTALPCAAAVRWFVVAQPLIAGLGLYAFLRGEGLARPAATAGGSVLALGIAGSSIVAALPFAGTLAWTAVTLACEARFFRSRTWSGRLAWAAATALAWGQIAASHLSHGLVLGTGALAVYAASALWEQGRDGALTWKRAVGTAVLLLAALPLVNLASLAPRLVYLRTTAAGTGYQHLQLLAQSILGRPVGTFGTEKASGPLFPLRFAAPVGFYLGGVSMLASFAGVWSRRHRPLVISFAVYGLVAYLGALGAFGGVVRTLLGWLPISDLTAHVPSRFGYGVVLAAAVLVGPGIEALREASPGRRALMMAPGAAVWLLLPRIFGLRVQAPLLLGLGVVAGAVVLLLMTPGRTVLGAAVPAVLLAELVANAFLGQHTGHNVQLAAAGSVVSPGRDASVTDRYGPLATVTTDASALLVQPPEAAAIRASGERLLTLGAGPVGGSVEKGTAVGQRLKASLESIPQRIEEAQGYNPAQSLRLWAFVQAENRGPPSTNTAVFTDATPQVLGLFGVGWILSPVDRTPHRSWIHVAPQDAWELYRLANSVSRVSLVASWRIVPSLDERLRILTGPSFDPSAEVILERDPGIEASGGSPPGIATYQSESPQSGSVIVNAAAPSVLLIRNVFDRNWHASVDGRATALLPADQFLQALVVPAGRHVVRLAYDDPWVGYGALGTALALLALLGTALALRLVSRARS